MSRELTQSNGHDVSTATAARPAVVFTPRVDVVETEDGLTCCADMPGVRPEDVDVRFHEGELVLYGRVSPHRPGGEALLAEYDTGDYYRTFTVALDVDADGITAGLRDGVLAVRLPKSRRARARHIEVRGE